MISKVRRTKDGAGAIRYALGKGKGHNGKKRRNEYISTVNMLPDGNYITQMERYWMRTDGQHENQMIKVIQSFSKNELNPNNPNDILLANQIGREYAEKYYPGFQAIVFTQIDGKGGYVHNHVFISDVNIYTMKAMKQKQYYLPNVREWGNAVASQYFELDFGKGATKDKVTQTERVKRENGEYIYKDDIKERVRMSAESAVTMADFEVKLLMNGLDFKKKTSKKHGEYYTFELVDMSKAPEGEKLPNHSLKSRSYKMGAEYSPEAVRNYIETKYPVRSIYCTKPEKKEELKQQEPKTPENDFSAYCDMIGEFYMTLDERGNLDCDWNKHAELQNRWKEYQAELKKEAATPLPEMPEVQFKQVSAEKEERKSARRSKRQKKYQNLQSALQGSMKQEDNRIVQTVLQCDVELAQDEHSDEEALKKYRKKIHEVYQKGIAFDDTEDEDEMSYGQW